MMISLRVKFVLAILVLLGVFYVGTRVHSTPVVIEKPVPQVTTVEVPKITEKLVKQYIPVEDRKQVTALLDENKQLKLNIQQLSVSLAEAQSIGKGTATVEVPPCPSLPTAPPVRVSFTDYRLSFQSVGEQASYTLTQKFSLVNSVSKTSKGTAVNLIRLYEIGPGTTRTLIPTIETTTLAVTPQTQWYVHSTIHAGLGVTHSTSSNTSWVRGGTAAIVWAQHGTTEAPQDTRFAIFSPAVMFTDTEKTLGLLPVSFNLGTLPRQPFTNVWLSPFVGIDHLFPVRITRFGLVLTAGF